MRKIAILCVLMLMVLTSASAGVVNPATTPLPPGFFSMDLFHTAYDTPGHFPTIPFGGIRPSDAGVSWVGIEPTNGNFSFTKLDTWIGLSVTNGEDMLLDLDRTPGWASSNKTSVDPTCNGCSWGPSDIASGDNFYKGFVTAVVNHSLASAKPIKYYEIWNEIDGGFWKDTNAHMVTMTNDAAAIIHALDPNAVVVGPSVSSCCTSGNGLPAMTAFLNAGGGANIDQVALHSYPSGSEPLFPDYILTELATVQSLMASNGIGSKPVIYTEGSYNGSTKTSKTDAQQVAFLGQQFLNMLFNPSVQVSRYYWFQWDNVTFGQLWAPGTGLNAEGVAYNQLYNWLVGSTHNPNACSKDATTQTSTCTLIQSNGRTAQILWNNSSTPTLTVPTTFDTFQTLDDSTLHSITNNQVILGPKPIMVTTIGSATIPPTPIQSQVGGTATLGVSAASPITVSLAPSATTLATSSTQTFILTLMNDVANAGANLTLSCTGTCGTLSAVFARTNATITYTAPSSANSTIVLKATSVQDSSRFVQVPITVTSTTPPAIVNFVSTPAAQAAASTNTYAIPATIGNSVIVPIGAATADVISGVQACSPSNVCTSLAQACPSVGACFGTTTPGGSSYQYFGVNLPPGLTSIVVSNSSPSGTIDIGILDVSGLGGLDVASIASTQTTATTTPTGPALTPSNTGELMVSNISLTGTANSVASPYIFAALNGGDGLAYQVETSITSYAPSYSSTSGTWSGFHAAYTLGTTPTVVRINVSPTSQNVQVGATQSFTATVTNDTTNSGIDWIVSGTSCSGATCGTLSSTHTTSGNSVTYTAPSSTPGASVSRIQHTSNVVAAASGSVTIAATGSSHLVCGIAVWNTASGTLAVTDPATDSFTSVISGAGTGVSAAMGCAPNASSGQTQLNFAVTGSSPTVMELYALEYAGVALASPVDQSTSATGSSSPMDSGSMSATTNATDLLVGFGYNGASLTFAAGNDGQGDAYTLLDQRSSIGSAVEDFFPTSATNTYKATLVPATASGSRMFVVAFKASSGGSSAVTLTATSTHDPTKSATSAITIGAAAILGVSVSPTSTSTTAGGGTVSITPTVSNDPPAGGVLWTFSGVGTLSRTSGPSGTVLVYTPPASVSSTQTVTITATSADDGTKSASTTITVSQTGTSTGCTGSTCPAFSGALGTASGGGAAGVGGSGRGGTGTPVVFEVTNLNDGGTGSLRGALEPGSCTPRFIVFRISGKITQKSRLDVTCPYVYIAGQTAPGGPITLGGIGQLGEGLDVRTHDVTVRFLSYDGYAVDSGGNPLTGPDNGTVGFEEALGGSGSDFNNMFDHLSIRWTGNKFLLYANDPSGNTSIHDSSWQYLLNFEPNTAHPVGPLLSAIGFPSHDTNNDFHHNMFINTGHRLPLDEFNQWRWVSNLTFNFDYFAGNQEGSASDYINNDWVSGNLNPGNIDPHPVNAVLGVGGPPGPSGTGNCLANCDLPGVPSIYMSGNRCGPGPGMAVGTDYQCSASEGGTDPEGFAETGSPIPSSWQRSTPLPAEKYPITADSAASLGTILPPTIGNWAHLACDGSILNNRDSQDSRVIAQYQARGSGGQFMGAGYNGPSPNPPSSTAPAIQPGTPCASTLHDGISDAWKTKYGFSTTDTTFWKSVGKSGYLRIEEFLNGIVPQ